MFTDAVKSYEDLEVEYLHQFVDHAIEYVKCHVHTNGVGRCWSLLNRSLNGTNNSVAPIHISDMLTNRLSVTTNSRVRIPPGSERICGTVPGSG